MHGGLRNKWTTFYVNHSAFSSLALTCDSSHDHQPWGVTGTQSGWKFNTADEAEYPALLCERVAAIIASVAKKHSVVFIPRELTQPQHHLEPKRLAAEAGRQPRGNLLPQIISEFKQKLTLAVPASYAR